MFARGTLQNYKLPPELCSTLGEFIPLSLLFASTGALISKLQPALTRVGVRLYMHIIVVGGAENACQSAANKGPHAHCACSLEHILIKVLVQINVMGFSALSQPFAEGVGRASTGAFSARERRRNKILQIN